MDSWELREARRKARLTLEQVARAAGTSESNVAAYERGAKHPGVPTERRLVTAIDAGSRSPVHRNGLLTLPAAAAAIRQALRKEWPLVDILRIVRQLVSDATYLENVSDWAAFLIEPSTTGDERWDAMLAAAAEHIALKANVQTPRWTVGHALGHLWFVSSLPDLDAYLLAHAPMPFAIRGVVVDEAALASV